MTSQLVCWGVGTLFVACVTRGRRSCFVRADPVQLLSLIAQAEESEGE